MEEDDFDFTDDEIREELSKLGYANVPDHRLKEFKKDLKSLIRHEYSKTTSQNSSFVSQRNHIDSSIDGRDTSDRLPLENASSIQQRPHLSQRSSQHTGKENYDFGMNPLMKQSLPVNSARIDGQFHMYDPTTDQSYIQHRDDVSETDTERRLFKRKVLRKKDDGSKVIDESVTESDVGSLLDLNERLRELGIEDGRDIRRPQSAREDPPYRLSPDDPRPASVILRPVNNPHTKHLRKSDPVARYQQFRQSWLNQKAPGEKRHKNLRWNIREQMLAQDNIVEKKPQKVYVPNGYVVPTDKKRKDLRWQIRMDIAHGQMPPHGFYHEY